MPNSTRSPQGSDPYEDRRAHPRVTVALPAFLQGNGERHSVQILDLSAGGAKLNCAADLPAGTAVMLECGTLRREAMIRWQSGPVVGLSFDESLDERDVTALAKRSTALAGRMKTAE